MVEEARVSIREERLLGRCDGRMAEVKMADGIERRMRMGDTVMVYSLLGRQCVCCDMVTVATEQQGYKHFHDSHARSSSLTRAHTPFAQLSASTSSVYCLGRPW